VLNIADLSFLLAGSYPNENYFESKYINSTILPPSLKRIRPVNLPDPIGTIPFCEVASKTSLSNISLYKPTTCNYFHPMLTPKGFCYSFNSLTMNELFKPSDVLNVWNSHLDLKLDSTLINPTGHGPSHGLNFALNAYEPFSQKRTSKNFIMSITNPTNPFSIFEENYILKPGYFYIFKIIANDIVTSTRFDGMDAKSRNCSLPHETQNLNLLKVYSKGGCNYECAIENAKSDCDCLPWYVPRRSDEKIRFCDEEQTGCFDHSINTFQTKTCNCSSDCRGLSFSIFESKTSFENPGEFCTKTYDNMKKTRDFPKTVFCELCGNVVRNNRIRVNYDHIMNDGFDVNRTFCDKFLTDNVALVKIEMVTKSITRSIKDKRYNFVAQLSSLGKYSFLVDQIFTGSDGMVWYHKSTFFNLLKY
jgi:hypothetical protein